MPPRTTVRSTLRPRELFVAALLATLAPARHADAVDLSASALRMNVRVAPPNARVCVAFPEDRRNDAACPDVRLPPAAVVRADIEPNGTGPVALAAIVFPDMRVQLTIEQSPGATAHASTASEVSAFVGDVRSGFARTLASAGQQLAPVEAGDGPETLTIGGVRVVRHVLRVVGAGARRMLMFHAFGRAGIATFSFQTDATHLPRVEALARDILSTLRMPAAR